MRPYSCEICQDLEVEMFAIFFKTLYSTQVQMGMEDKMHWRLGKNERFSVWSFYEVCSLLGFPLENCFEGTTSYQGSLFFLVAYKLEENSHYG